MLAAAEGDDSSTSLPTAVLAVLGMELARQGTLRIANASMLEIRPGRSGESLRAQAVMIAYRQVRGRASMEG